MLLKEDLASVEAQVGQLGISVNTHVINKGRRPGQDIVTFAADNKVDAIYIGVKRRSKVGKLLYGSNAQYVIIKAHCPVTIVK
jgi:nucleotide-binding universal stress UspA family protein